MTEVPLRALNLEEKWPKLSALQNEIGDLEARLHKARSAVNVAQNELPRARERDIAAEAKAMRASKKLPEPEHEPRVEAERLEAERMAQRLAHALQAAREDYGTFLALHQAELYRDVLEARAEVAREAAEAAQVTQAAYSRWADMAYLVKHLTPPEPIAENMPAARLTQSFAGVIHTTQRGPARGDIEAALQYIGSLAPVDEEPDDAEDVGDDAA